MDFAMGSDGYESFCGTSYASKVLGISIGTVQGLVERNELRGWRTNGGHRRISLKSIQEYQHRHNLHPNTLMCGEDRLKVVVVEDDEATRLMLKMNFDRWGPALGHHDVRLRHRGHVGYAEPAPASFVDRFGDAPCRRF